MGMQVVVVKRHDKCFTTNVYCLIEYTPDADGYSQCTNKLSARCASHKGVVRLPEQIQKTLIVELKQLK